MNTVSLKTKAQTRAPKQILVTMKSDVSHSHVRAAIAAVGRNRNIKIVDHKSVGLTKSSIFLKKVHSLAKYDGVNDSLPKITRIGMANKNILKLERSRTPRNRLVCESQFFKNCSTILYQQRGFDNSCPKLPGIRDAGDLEHGSSESTATKHNRCVPNILRSGRAAQNALNPVGFHKPCATRSTVLNEHCEEHKIVKRTRKQVLRPLDLKSEHSRKCQDFWTKLKSKQSSLPTALDNSLIQESKDMPPKSASSNIKQDENMNESLSTEMESSVTSEESATDSADGRDLYAANLEVSHLHPILNSNNVIQTDYDDNLMQKVFAEFEVPDYQNYIASEDLCYDVDEMDKLLSSDMDGSITEEPILHRAIDTLEYDMNGNNIKKYIDKNLQIQQNDESLGDLLVDTSAGQNWEPYSDGICFPAMDNGVSCASAINLWRNEIHEFQEFPGSSNKESLSTDTGSEPETRQVSSTKSVTTILSKNHNFDVSATSLTVSNVMPDNVFSDELYQPSSDGSSESGDDGMKQLFNCSSTTEQYQHSTTDSSDSVDYTANKGVEGLGLGEGICVLDDGLTNNCDFVTGDRIYTDCGITDETNMALRDARVLNEDGSLFPQFDAIENSDLLKSADTCIDQTHSVSNIAQKRCKSKESVDILNSDMARQMNVNNVFNSNYHNALFSNMKIGKVLREKAGRIPQAACTVQSTSSNATQGGTSVLLKNSIETGTLKYYTANKRSHKLNSVLRNASSRGINDQSSSCAETKSANNVNSGSRCSKPLLIIKKNWKSESENVLMRKQFGADYSAKPSITYNLKSNPKILKNRQHCKGGIISQEKRGSHVVGYSQTDILYSTLSDKSWFGDLPGHQNIQADSDYYVVCQQRNVLHRKSSNNLDDISQIDRKHCNKLTLYSSSDDDPYKFQINVHETTSEVSASSGKIRISRVPDRGSRRDRKKRKKKETQQISYYPCEFCEKKYRSEAALVCHIRINHRYASTKFNYRNKKYVCDKCSKEYFMATAIEKHFKLHENYRICEKHFSEKTYLRRHVHSCHKNWSVECVYCSRRFPRKNYLTQHLKRCHGIQQVSTC